jgi:ABC-2 type transport system permease protein
MFGPALDWPAWLTDVSPLAWVPAVPVESWAVAPAAALTAVAAGLLVAGFGGFRRRDVVTG